MPEEQSKPQSQPAVETRKVEDFTSLYANSIRYESSVWDLKLLFGELDQLTGKEVVELHTSVSIPWMQVKLMVEMLRLNVDAYELEFGKIAVPLRVIPPEIELTPDQAANPIAKAVIELANKRRAEFIASLGT